MTSAHARFRQIMLVSLLLYATRAFANYLGENDARQTMIVSPRYAILIGSVVATMITTLVQAISHAFAAQEIILFAGRTLLLLA
mmetsp:Transcript_23134/g.40965  ORF Transcript_23134/g.40965 Transcript_23134/m.40965 type:complete len:84 (+) Transcript_23134:577-828(+)